MLCDSKGVVYKGRTEGMNKYKERFLVETNAAHFDRCLARRGCVLWLVGGKCDDAGDGQD